MRALFLSALSVILVSPSNGQNSSIVVSQIYGGGGNAGPHCEMTTSSCTTEKLRDLTVEGTLRPTIQLNFAIYENEH
jgi:hypothetical protein